MTNATTSAADSNATATDSEADLDSATAVIVTFHPQIWRNDHAVTGTETETYALPIEDVLDENGELPESNTDESDELAWHDDAPKRARQWQGPFYVTVGGVR